MELLTITEAAKQTSKTRKAIARLVEREVLPSKLDDAGRRVIPVAALEARGLEPQNSPNGDGEPQGEPQPPPSAALDLAPLISKLEELAAENGRLKALTETVERHEGQLQDELIKTRSQVADLEAQLERRRRRWWR